MCSLSTVSSSPARVIIVIISLHFTNQLIHVAGEQAISKPGKVQPSAAAMANMNLLEGGAIATSSPQVWGEATRFGAEHPSVSIVFLSCDGCNLQHASAYGHRSLYACLQLARSMNSIARWRLGCVLCRVCMGCCSLM